MDTDLSLFCFDQDVKEIIDMGEYPWEKLSSLLAIFTGAQSDCTHLVVSQDNVDEEDNEDAGIKHGFFPNSITDRFKGYDSLLTRQGNRSTFIGCSQRQKYQGEMGFGIHDSGILWDKNYFFTIDSKFEFLGPISYEFELGEINNKSAEIKSKVIFQGRHSIPDLHNLSRIYLAQLEDGKLVEK